MWLLAWTGCWLIKVGLTPSEIRSLTTFQDRLQTIIPFSSLIGLLSVGNHLLSLRKCGLSPQLSKIWSKNVGITQLVVMLDSFYTKNSYSFRNELRTWNRKVFENQKNSISNLKLPSNLFNLRWTRTPQIQILMLSNLPKHPCIILSRLKKSIGNKNPALNGWQRATAIQNFSISFLKSEVLPTPLIRSQLMVTSSLLKVKSKKLQPTI